tara:strand:- start:1311 stop:2150 length:840 start_codon:yes stop_codon:yes gene_type:complete
MKICIIYTTAYNLADFTLDSHKYLFDLLNELNIEYDVFISISNEIVVKHTNKEKLIDFYNKIKGKLNQYHGDNVETYFENSNRWYYHFKKTVSEEYISKKFENLVGQKNIKHIDFKISELSFPISCHPEKNGSTHTVDDLFHVKCNYYRRLTRISKLINKNKYDKFINLRSDFEIIKDNSLKEILQKEFKPDKDFFYMSRRINVFTISNKLMIEWLNKTKYKNLVETEDKEEKDSIHNLVKSRNHLGEKSLHVDLHLGKLCKKMNIEFKRVNIMKKLAW